MERIKYRHRHRSILWGALFFLFSVYTPRLHASDTLSVTPFRDRPASAPDSLKTAGQIPFDVRDTVSDREIHDSPYQAGDSLSSDELQKEEKIYSPQQAMILSATLPGLGQAYVGKYWKIPIIYGIGYGLYHYFALYDSLYQHYRILYEEAKINGEDTQNYDIYRDGYLQRKTYCVIGMGILYLANIVDAMTDAYFKSFDISPDLSLQISPKVTTGPVFSSNPMNVNYGFALCFRFK